MGVKSKKLVDAIEADSARARAAFRKDLEARRAAAKPCYRSPGYYWHEWMPIPGERSRVRCRVCGAEKTLLGEWLPIDR